MEEAKNLRGIGGNLPGSNAEHEDLLVSGPGMISAKGHGLRGTGEETAMDSHHTGVTRWLQLIQAEYREIPDLSLSKAQMQRL